MGRKKKTGNLEAAEATSTAVVRAEERGVVVANEYIERQIELAHRFGVGIEILNRMRIVQRDGGYKLVPRVNPIDIFGILNGKNPQDSLFAYNPMEHVLNGKSRGKYNDESRIMFDSPSTVEVGEVMSWTS